MYKKSKSIDLVFGYSLIDTLKIVGVLDYLPPLMTNTVSVEIDLVRDFKMSSRNH